MALSDEERNGLEELYASAREAALDLNGTLKANMDELHKFLLVHQREFQERVVELRGIPRGPGLVRSFVSSKYGLHLYFDEEGVYELCDTKVLHRGDLAGEQSGVTEHINIAEDIDLSKFGFQSYVAFLKGVKEFLEEDRRPSIILVPVGYYVFQYISQWAAGGHDTLPKDNYRVYPAENAEFAVAQFRNLIVIGDDTHFRNISMAAPGHDHWRPMTEIGQEVTRHSIDFVVLPEEFKHA